MWYAIPTENGQEEAVRQRIRDRMPKGMGHACRVLYCIQKRRYLGQWHDKRERFLPGYVFWIAEGDRSGGSARELEERLTGAGLCGISRLLENSAFSGMCGQNDMFGPVPVSREDEELLIRLTEGTEDIGMSYGVIREGRLKICDGALAGMESRVRRIDRHKRKGYIGMNINGKETMAEIGLEITEKTYFTRENSLDGGACTRSCPLKGTT